MQSFRFSLESVLQFQNQKRDECLGKMSAINRRVIQFQENIESIATQREELRNYLGAQTENSVLDVGLMSRCYQHLTQLEYQQRRAEMDLAGTQEERERARQELVEAEKKVKALEKLKEKQFEEYQLRLERQFRQEQEDTLASRLIRELES